jgi:hypothetical protein
MRRRTCGVAVGVGAIGRGCAITRYIDGNSTARSGLKGVENDDGDRSRDRKHTNEARTGQLAAALAYAKARRCPILRAAPLDLVYDRDKFMAPTI